MEELFVSLVHGLVSYDVILVVVRLKYRSSVVAGNEVKIRNNDKFAVS